MKHTLFEELPWKASKHYVAKFSIFLKFNDISDTLQNFMFIETRVVEIVGGVLSTAYSIGERCEYQKAW